MPDLRSNNEDKKLFYRISEVAKVLNVSASLLRFWEKDFDCLNNISKNRKGDRLYSEQNINDLKVIFHLVKEKGYTLNGANEYMNKNKYDLNKNQAVISSLQKIRTFLEELKDSL